MAKKPEPETQGRFGLEQFLTTVIALFNNHLSSIEVVVTEDDNGDPEGHALVLRDHSTKLFIRASIVEHTSGIRRLNIDPKYAWLENSDKLSTQYQAKLFTALADMKSITATRGELADTEDVIKRIYNIEIDLTPPESDEDN